MELPQSRPFGTEGRKPTHDFLSLYSPVQQDPRPSPSRSPQGAYLETHDFLQPLDQVGKNIAKEGNKIEVTSIEKPPPPAPPPSVERTLPGGIGTYSISHVSFINQSQRVPKPEGVMFTVAQSSSSDRNDENSNCSSYTGSGFTLWEESAMKKGKTGKENIAGDRQVIREAGMRMGGGQWTASLERPSLSSSNHNHRSTISSLSSSQPSSAPKNQSFVDMIKSARSAQEDDEDDEEEFVIKKETSPNHKANLSVKVDAKGNDQKPNTPRSKHSATEQRRRSKINDRFSMLRELIPHSDQKRDKASFLLEVIEYIQYLQEKVHKNEDSYQGWNNGPTKLIPWGNNQRPTEGFIDQPRGSTSGPPPVYAKFDEHTTCVPPMIPRNGQNLAESNMSSADTTKELDHSRLTNKVSPFPAALQSNIFSPGGSSNAAAPISPRLASGNDNGASQPQSQLWNTRSCLTDCSDKLKEQELTIDSGTISVSTVYSQGLLNTLTHALQNSGVDLSQASISVQIDLGKRANSTTMNSSSSMHKINDAPSSNQALVRSRIASSTGEECDVQALKRFKTGIS